MLKSNKVDLSLKARQALEIEAALRRMTLRDLASELILGSVSQKTLNIISDENTNITKHTKLTDADSEPKHLRLANDPDALNMIKELWNRNPRPSLSTISKEVGRPRATVHENIKRMINGGMLPP